MLEAGKFKTRMFVTKCKPKNFWQYFNAIRDSVDSTRDKIENAKQFKTDYISGTSQTYSNSCELLPTALRYQELLANF